MEIPKVHRAIALTALALAILQFFLAGLFVFGGDGVDAHRIVGSLVTLLALVALVLAISGRPEAKQASAVLLGLALLQHVLAIAGEDVAVLGALHPVNGLLIILAAMLAAAGRPVRMGPPHGARPAA
jgi:hypothetical protein